MRLAIAFTKVGTQLVRLRFAASKRVIVLVDAWVATPQALPGTHCTLEDDGNATGMVPRAKLSDSTIPCHAVLEMRCHIDALS